jgi:serine/threonine-protein kinase
MVLLAVLLGVLAFAFWWTGREAPDTPTGLDSTIRVADGMEMVLVPEGSFEMGSGGFGWIRLSGPRLHLFPDERPGHKVLLDTFWIDRTEVTVGMFRAFVADSGYVSTAERDGWGKPWRDGPKDDEWPKLPGTDWRHPGGPGSTTSADHPVVQVSWEDATAYCAWAGGSLPSEAQWEKAARGTDGRRFPWGNSFDGMKLNACGAECPVERWRDSGHDDGHPRTSPVGSFPAGASPYGAQDMAGNVWEWVADWYSAGYDGDAPSRNPRGPSTGTLRAMRGGAWYDGEAEAWATCTVRHQNPPWDRYEDVGFRCMVAAEVVE